MVLRVVIISCFWSLLAMRTFGQSLDYRQGEVIVMLRPGASISALIRHTLNTRIHTKSSLSAEKLSENMNIYLVKFDFASLGEDQLVREFKVNSSVLLAQKNHLIHERNIPNDTYFFRQWQHYNDGSLGGVAGADFRTTKAWDIATGGITELGDTIVVCVVDGGLEQTHGDLKSNIWYNYREIPANGIDDDGNGYIDDYKGWNTYKSNDSIEVNNHGTQVSGIIGAKGNNRIGVAGVNWNVKIMMVQGGGDEANAVLSYNYPLQMRKMYNESGGQKGAYVVATNSSWGRDYGKAEESPIWCAMYDSLGNVGILNACSTANLDINVDLEGDLPTNCTSDYLIGVTNINNEDLKVRRAGYGPKSIEIGAYGEDVFGTASGNTFGYFNGTSAASPHVAGAIALLYSAPCNAVVTLSRTSPASAALLAKDIILQNVRQLNDLVNLVSSGGVLNIYDMMRGLTPVSARAGINKLFFKTDQAILSAVTVQYRKVGDVIWNEIIIKDNKEYESVDLEKCNDYEYRVKGNCERFRDSFSNVMVLRTLGCCLPPAQIKIVETGFDNAMIEFKGLGLLPEFFYTITDETKHQTDSFLVKNYTDPIFAITGLVRCTEYHVRLYTLCDQKLSIPSTVISFRTSGCDQCDDIDYCIRDRPASEFEWIESVEIDQQAYVTGNNLGYGNFAGTGMSWNLVRSSTHQMIIEPGYSLDSSLLFMAAWLDMNHNAVFEDQENLIPQGFVKVGSAQFNFVIPATARTGITRLRVIAKYGENGISPPTACFSGIEFGEYEDYCVGIVDANCQPVTSVRETTKTSTSISFQLTKSDANDILTYKYRKTPYGLWTEGSVFDSKLQISNLDSCSEYELRLIHDCDPVLSVEKVVKFDTKTVNCLVASKDNRRLLLNAYPNPFQDEIFLRIESPNEYRIKILALTGEEVWSTKMHGSSNPVRIQPVLDPGVYLLIIQDGNGILMTQKIIHN
ncbi:MAG: S8 family peptidase [Saprospiraceae bacterium]